MTRIELAYLAWEASALPLSYIGMVTVATETTLANADTLVSTRAPLRPRHPRRDRRQAHCARPVRPRDDPAVQHRCAARQVLPGVRQPQVPAHRPGGRPVRPDP